jgi:purine nucleosidase
LFTTEHIAGFARTGGAVGRALADLLTTYDRSDIARFGRPGGPIHDAMTIAWLLRPELFKGHRAAIGVQVTGQTAGYSYADYHGKTERAARATIIDSVDEAGFIALLSQRLSFYGQACEAALEAGG